MEESPKSAVLEGIITGVRFGLATAQEIRIASNSDCPINHASQLSNPFLGLPLESGKCESCGTAEPGQCEGHFGYIELPVPIYHPSHVSELKRMLSLICLKCLKMKNRKFQSKNIGVLERAFSICCEEASQISVNEVKTPDGACYLELKIPSRSRPREGFWNFLEKYGFRYGDNYSRPLLPSEAMVILRKLPAETKRKLTAKGYFSQEGYIMQYLPVPPNCLSVPDVSDGISVMSSDVSTPMLKKVLKQVEIIKSSRSGMPNFESLEAEVNDLQASVIQYLQVRGTKATHQGNTRYGMNKELNDSSSTKAWLDKMKTLFISKGSGFSSRSVITGDSYKGVSEIGLPFEIAQRITFEERVNDHNINYLQKLVDEKLCLTFKDGSSTYSLREGSKGHTSLKLGQIVHRRVMEGDIIFLNRPPTTHKHSLQALSVYIHEDHTVKINPLICGPLSADFDGDCIHIFYPQSPEAKAEVLELFAVGKQLLSSHSGNLNLQLATDSLLSLKTMFNKFFFNKPLAQQLALFASTSLPSPTFLKALDSAPFWTVMELLESSLPPGFDCYGERFFIKNSKILKLDFNRDVMQSIINEIVTSIFFSKGPTEVLQFFNSLQPMLMENLYSVGFSLSLEDFVVPKEVLKTIHAEIQDGAPLLYHLRTNYNELIELQLDKHMRVVKVPVSNFIIKSSSMGDLIDLRSDSAINRIVQQIGFLGLQLSDKGKLYSKTLVEDMASIFHNKYPSPEEYPSEEFGMVRNGLFHGLDPYQEMVHSISSREVMVRSTRGLTEPGTLFKNLMAILHDVVICYDGTVRNVCSNSIVQFEYGPKTQNLFGAGEPVGVLAATAITNPAYKAVLDSSASSNSSWEMMKEILLCGVNFKNVPLDRRVVLYLNDCDCGRKYCRENAAYVVKNHLRKVSLKDVATEFLIEYKQQQVAYESSEIDTGLVGHVHLNQMLLKESNISMEEVLEKCQDSMSSFRKKKKVGQLFKRIALSCSECSFEQSCESKFVPCLKFFWQDTSDIHIERTSRIFADTICPVLLETIIKGDPRVREANIIWISPGTMAWIRNPCKDQKGELAVDVVLEKEAVKKSGDAWRTVLDSCLPVLHLIDTKRSIPYAIKEIQDLLGISCAFEQAVQRLHTSVSMVTKGVLKEHLILLANSMTCSGNLVGFNTGGIKALSKTLNVQVPFTEATLFTPKRCFERAAEKCHADSLSSVVASCSWGKPVAIGTGSRFDILWDKREVDLNQQDGTDVYSFLHMLRSSPEDEVDSACLGGEVDSFDMEYMDGELSPEHTSGLTKPVFEDAADFDFDFDRQKGGADPSQSNWDVGPSSNIASSGGWDQVVKRPQVECGSEKPSSDGWSQEVPARSSGWGGAESKEDNSAAGSWSSWGKKENQAQQEQTEKSGVWARKEIPENSWGNKDGQQPEPHQTEKSSDWSSEQPQGSSWAKMNNPTSRRKKDDQPSSQLQENEKSSAWGSDQSKGTSWGKRESQTSWGKKDEQPSSEPQETGKSSAWGSDQSGGTSWGKKDNQPSWGKKDDQPSSEPQETGKSSAWGSDQSGGTSWGKKDNQPSWGKKDDQPSSEPQETGKSSAWGSDQSGGTSWGKKDNQPSWGKKDDQPSSEPQEAVKSSAWGSDQSRETSWAKKDIQPSWGKKDDQPSSEPLETEKSSAWGSDQSRGTSWGNKDNQPSWGKKVDQPASEPHETEKSNAWTGTSWGKKDNQPTWGKKDDQPSFEPQKTEKHGAWSSEHSGGTSWDKKDNQSTETSGDWASQQSKDVPLHNGANEESQKSDKWGSSESVKGPEKSGSWGWSKKAEQKPDQGGWKKKEGWGAPNAGDWKNKKDRPARPIGGSNDGPRASGAFTATRQRLDMFPSDEQDVLVAVEAVMQAIRRIMHQTGYNDGDPFSAEDQAYILDNVLSYHPDKVQKMGSGVDYIMVNKHSNFQDSRCLYVVSTDGRKEDFSYRKCLENFIREKYPDKADSFISKYFQKPQPRRPGWNRDRGNAGPMDEAGTPRTPRTPRTPFTPDEEQQN